MKRILPLIFLLVVGATIIFSPRTVKASGPYPFTYFAGAASSSSSSSSGGGGGSYLLEERFESGGGAFATNAVGDWNFADTATPLEGTKSASSFSFTLSGTFGTFTSSTECWMYFQYRTHTLPSGFSAIAAIRDAAGAALVEIGVQSNGAAVLNASVEYQAMAAGTIAIDTTYTIFLHYIKGTGSNSTASISISTNGILQTSGAGFTGLTSGNRTANAAQAYIHNEASEGGPCRFDTVIANNTTIPNNP